jgi:hypothetical protein
MALAYCSCGQHREKKIGSLSTVTPELIQVIIDSTLALDAGLNTGYFLLDPGILSSIDKEALNKYKHQNNSVELANLDSLFQNDSTWVNYKFFQNPVIRFDKIVPQNNGTILIQTSKHKASDGSIGTEMIFQKEGNSYKCLKSEITWIS